MSIAMSATSSSTTGDDHKMALLKRARLARLQWVLQAKDAIIAPAFSSSRNNTISLPGQETMQEVLHFLNELCSMDPQQDGDQHQSEDDELSVDLDSLLLSVPLSAETEDEVDDLVRAFQDRQNDSMSSYELFLQKLLLPQSAHVVKALQQFVVKFSIATRRAQAQHQFTLPTLNSTNSTQRKDPHSMAQFDDEIKRRAATIWDFLDHVFDVMRVCNVWSNESPEAFELSKQSCENLVFSKLHRFLFATEREEVALNAQTHERIELLSFISAEHLDIQSVQHLCRGATVTVDPVRDLLAGAIAELARLGCFQSPQDKLQCLRRCSVNIATVLKQCRNATDGGLPGADELLPMMILALKYSNPPALHSEMYYLQRYTRPRLLTSEAGYLITHFVSAVYFLDSVDAQALTIEPEAFEMAMINARGKAKHALKKSKKGISLSVEQTDLRTMAEDILDSLSTKQLVEHYQRQILACEAAEPMSMSEYVKLNSKQ
jgi:hypothetical protein